MEKPVTPSPAKRKAAKHVRAKTWVHINTRDCPPLSKDARAVICEAAGKIAKAYGATAVNVKPIKAKAVPSLATMAAELEGLIEDHEVKCPLSDKDVFPIFNCGVFYAKEGVRKAVAAYFAALMKGAK